ncbi:MAG: hypothetical protein KJ950_15255 [Proteobacteria bacterium]|nr:hypothetical protein [Pseudomonadota bacterium]MBU1686882.1 hypothetical protein [Pseudomonadota bacterium]
MKKKIGLQIIAGLFFILQLTGCGSSIMTRVPTIEKPDAGMALVTVMRPSLFGGGIKFSLWDGENFQGILTAKSYIQFQATPGKHMLMARAENWSGVDAELQAGRHYYVIARPIMGAWKARVALDPVSRDQYNEGQVEKWMKGLTPTAVIDGKGENYAAPRLEQVRTAISNFNNGQAKSMPLSAADGI